MNSNVLLLAIFLSLAMNAFSQPARLSVGQVYNVQPNTKGNRIELTLANDAPAAAAEQIEVKATRYPQGITFSSDIQTIEDIPPQGQRTVSFTFDVGRPSKIDGERSRTIGNNALDTIKFLITERSGGSWEKLIIVTYALPATFALEQNFPNPFNPATTINYQLPHDAYVTITLYDVLGREVKTLVNQPQPAGYHQISVELSSFAGGVYFYRMTAQSARSQATYTSVKKLLFVK